MKKPRLSTTAAVRLGLGVFGVAGMVFGVYSLLTRLDPTALFGLAAWLAVSVLVHDGVVVPLTTATGYGVRRMGANLHALSRNLIRGALVLGAVFTLLVAPLVRAQQVAGNPPVNATVLQDNYALTLGILWGFLLLATALSVASIENYWRGTKRQISRS